MRFIVCYDIADDKKRLKVSKLLKAHGIRTQKSLFEVECDEKTILSVLEEVEQVIDPIDKFFIYPVDNKNIKKIIRLGVAQYSGVENIV
ncbi:CRISPR-associated endonuclease Cas2 [Persephonella sp.]|uniref:CRISPR-associated endonuclease Cas2 n=1 Tax=Persephonella sp. TaxID=2060922 RepID=UPI0025E0C9C9|nr:CRISPR-associated endonuclease Cas2 [Persephonella sp.]